jgi:hypothetical protein
MSIETSQTPNRIFIVKKRQSRYEENIYSVRPIFLKGKDSSTYIRTRAVVKRLQKRVATGMLLARGKARQE